MSIEEYIRKQCTNWTKKWFIQIATRIKCWSEIHKVSWCQFMTLWNAMQENQQIVIAFCSFLTLRETKNNKKTSNLNWRYLLEIYRDEILPFISCLIGPLNIFINFINQIVFFTEQFNFLRNLIISAFPSILMPLSIADVPYLFSIHYENISFVINKVYTLRVIIKVIINFFSHCWVSSYTKEGKRPRTEEWKFELRVGHGQYSSWAKYCICYSIY